MHRMTCSPSSSAVCTFWLMDESLSPTTCRRSLCPTIAYLHPHSTSIAGLTSPVNAPFFSALASWAPSATADPLIASATGSSHGYGGHTATSTAVLVPTPLAIPAARALASARVVFIFQLPATSFRRAIRIPVGRAVPDVT